MLRRPIELAQYACGDYRKLLRLHGIKASMSRKGNCLDNAPMESFFGSLKTELVHRTRFSTRREAKAALFEYIEIFYKPTTAPLKHRLPDAGTGQEGYDHRSDRIGEEPPGPDFGVNVRYRLCTFSRLRSQGRRMAPRPRTCAP